MMNENNSPKTLLEAVRYFSDLDVCHAYMVKIKWPDGQVCCPECGCIDVGEIKSRRMFQCKTKRCRKQFSVKVGTIFEDSALGLDKWIVAVWCIVNAKNGISSCELARAIGVTQKSAWHMLHRIRLAMQTKSFRQITGEIEADETFIGGRLANMHKAKKDKVIAEFGPRGRNKTVVAGQLERGGEVRAQVIKTTQTRHLVPIVRKNIKPGSTIYTDILTTYKCLSDEYIHEVVNHAKCYVQGRIHTNGLENFWSLLKRCIRSTYVAVDPEHLQRYLDEQCRRFNMRKGTDASRFHAVMQDVVGRRLEYADLTHAESVGPRDTT